VRAVDFRVLGSLEVVIDGNPIELGSRRIRRLLAALLVHPNEVVSTHRLVDLVWSDAEPVSGIRALKTNVSRLRTLLEPGRGPGESSRIVTRAPGYALTLELDELDAARFEQWVTDAERLLSDGDALGAVVAFDRALGLWRGPALVEFADEDWARPVATALEERRTVALEGRIESRLACGLHADVVGELEALIDRYPLRDRLRAQLMVALHRSGRQADALRAYQAYRAVLGEELGLTPSPELVQLEARIVAQDPALHAGVTAGRPVRGYLLLEPLGEGPSGVVYRAVQPSVGREVAVKVLHPALANDADFIRRFERDAQVVSRLEHPHVVPLYDAWRDARGAFVVMRWLRGGGADAALDRGPLPLVDVRRVVDEVGGALATAHARGLVHGNVKPSNVLFDDHGHAYLGDFGPVAGAPAPIDGAHRAPEQRDRWAPSTAGDQWALGQVVRALLTGRTGHAGAVLPAVAAVLERACAASPTERFPDVAAFVDAFSTAVSSSTSSLDVVPGPGAARHRSGAESAVRRAYNPYKGLRPFLEADADDFFGRERSVDELVARLAREGSEARFIAVVGPSGSGKSSLVRAGLVPRLRAGAVAGSASWFVATMLPGADPFGELDAALRRIAVDPPADLAEQLGTDRFGIARAAKRFLPDDTAELLLVVDQFEELFTLVEDPKLATRFLDGLVAAVRDPHARLRVVTTLRADFYDRPLRHPGLGELLPAHQVTVTAMTPAELTAAITGPAARVGAAVEPGLAATIVADVGDHPAALPLLQYALAELFDIAEDDALTTAGYHEIGTVAGALARRADQVLAELPAEAHGAARQVFTRLVTLGEGTADTRRRTSRRELVTLGADAEVVERLIDRYGAARVLTFDRDPDTREPTVEIAHEALIGRWPRLAAWVAEDRDGVRLVRHLTAAAQGWAAADHDPGELYRGGRLDVADAWAVAHPDDLTALEADFLAASRDRRDEEARVELERVAAQARQNRRLRRLLAGVAAALVVALVAGLVSLDQRGEAADQRDRAEHEAAVAIAAEIAAGQARDQAVGAADRARQSEQTAVAARAAADIDRMLAQSRAVAATDRERALLLAVEADRRAHSPASQHALQTALVGSPGFLGNIGATTTGGYTDVEYSADGRRLAAKHDAGVVIWDMPERRLVQTVPTDDTHASGIGLALSPDGATVAVLGEPAGTRLVAVASGETTVTLAHGSPSYDAAFLPDGSHLAVGHFDGTAEIWDVQSGAVTVRLDTSAGFQARVAVSSHGDVVATSGAFETQVWRTGTGERVGPPINDFGSTSVAFSPDGSKVAISFLGADLETSGLNGSVRVLAVGSSAPIAVLHSRDTPDLFWRTVFADDRTVAAGTSDRVLRWDIGDLGAPALLPPIEIESEGASGLAVDPDTRTLAVGTSGGVSLWALDGRQLLADALTLPEPLAAVAAARLRLTVSTNADLSRLVASSAGLPGAAFWWDLTAARPEAERLDEELGAGPVRIARFSADGRLLVTVHQDDTLRAWDPSTFAAQGRPVPLTFPYTEDNFQLLAVSPDHRLVAVANRAETVGPGTVRVVDLSAGTVVATLHDLDAHTDPLVVLRNVVSLTFDRAGTRLAASNFSGVAVIWDTATFAPVAVAPRDSYALDYSPDGRFVITSTLQDNAIVVRNADDLQPVGARLVGHVSLPFRATVHPEGERLVTSGNDGVRLWDLASGAELASFEPSADPAVARANATPWVSSDGRHMVTADPTHLYIWRLDPTEWPSLACRAAGRDLTREEWEQFGPDDEYRRTCPDPAVVAPV
jgi:DNA-binding SARP family transcriptional activator/WD40 repeat protein